MKIKFETLTLQCRKSREVIDFSPQISYFHGPISTGKSSIARLIDFCLGGKLERTPAIDQELVSVQLSALVGEYEVLFEREAEGSNQVQVSWRNRRGVPRSVLAPITASSARGPIWGTEVYNLSDLIFHLLGFSPIKVRLSKLDPDAKLVRLSFRDIMWYCYLKQDDLDSSFFWLRRPILDRKSRYVMLFMVRAYTARLNELEIELSKTRNLKSAKKEEVRRLRSFLEQFGYSSDSEINTEIENINKKLAMAKSRLSGIREGHIEDTHFVDELRDRLRESNIELSTEEQVLIDLNNRINEQDSLKAELLTAKFKLARSKSAKEVLAGTFFEYCPACGMKIDSAKTSREGICALCGQSPSKMDEQPLLREEMIRHDLDSRIKELTESIEKHKKAQVAQQQRLANLKEEKSLLDRRLEEELANYDSKFLARSRETDRQIAAFEERVRGLKKTLEMVKAVDRLEKEADMLSADEEGLKRGIKREKDKLDAADKYLQEIEDEFLQSLLAVGVPGVKESDRVKINRTTWVPDILTGGKEATKWNFYNAGSAGKKTLLNVCYALSIHKVATEHGLPLPTFLIIDTPMKNIGEEVNRNIFEAFYTYLYTLAEGALSDTQFIIIDKEYFPPPSEKINIRERYMTQKDDKHPPLIPYYHGS